MFQQVFIPWYIKKNYSETGYPLANAPRHVHWLAWIAPVNSPDLDILNRACYDNMPELAESLLKRGADPNGQGDGYLHWAVRKNRYNIVELLLAQDGIKIQPTQKGRYPHENCQTLRMLKLFKPYIHMKTSKGNLLFSLDGEHSGGNCEHYKMTEYLLQQGLDPNYINQKNKTVLHDYHHPQMIELYLDYGFNRFSQIADAHYSSIYDISHGFDSKNSKRFPQFFILREHDPDYKVNINKSKIMSQMTICKISCSKNSGCNKNQCGSLAAVSLQRFKEILAIPELDINKVFHSRTRLHSAISQKNITVIKLLLNDKRIDLHIKNKDNQSPMDLLKKRNLLHLLNKETKNN
ncbi:MAG: ankyrin repeat domain-containing protein [Lentisphaeria bacterium]|nr:ankyrin repeat domain-containing protein [Lentisphaeria bacterium]NQZ67216.1 ankyrin repeat domain-containing protein [Lentisphaeria bacterium]